MARFERKYKIEGLEAATVEGAILLHPAGFRELYPDRIVNNVYFDTVELTTFRQNVDGVNQRKKFRLRWYGEDTENIRKPQFEIKIKHNELGTKEVYKVPDMTIGDISGLMDAANQFSNNFAPLFPVLLNAYLRSYYGSADGRFRITIDRSLRYYSMMGREQFTGFLHEEEGVILEVKYEEQDEDKAALVLQNLPFRHTKSSKYVNGVLMTSGF